MLVDLGRLFNFGTSLYQTMAVRPTTEEINDASTVQFIGVVPAGWKIKTKLGLKTFSKDERNQY